MLMRTYMEKLSLCSAELHHPQTVKSSSNHVRLLGCPKTISNYQIDRAQNFFGFS